MNLKILTACVLASLALPVLVIAEVTPANPATAQPIKESDTLGRR